MPTAVKNLLVATKQLQEVLRLWSVRQATETDVSNTYVTVGTEFNCAVEAFAQHKIDLRFVYLVLLRAGQYLTQMNMTAKSIRCRKTCEACWSNVWGKIRHHRHSRYTSQKYGKYCARSSKACDRSRRHGER